MQKNTWVIALIFLLTGIGAACLLFDRQPENRLPLTTNDSAVSGNPSIANPFAVKIGNTSNTENNRRLEVLENEVFLLNEKLQSMKLDLENLVSAEKMYTPAVSSATGNRFSSALTQRLYNIDHLIKGGLDASLAEDIVRRKNTVELKRLALQDRANRENYLNSQRYFDELAEINKQDISLREELGDERYDKYLFDSKQNNRIRIASVMLGSAAEQAGIKKGDIVLSYDNQRMFSWQELKDATAEGQLGEYVSISIYRNGEIFSYSVPRGPLGMQLGASRLPP